MWSSKKLWKALLYALGGMFLLSVVWVNVKKITQNERSFEIETIQGEKIAYFSGGCFWCTEYDFEQIEGVNRVMSGYLGGREINPDYADVASGNTGHREGVAVYYDDSKISYRDLVLVHMKTHDPTDPDGSFYDRGYQYSSAIYYQDDIEREIAQSIINEVGPIFASPIATSLEPFTTFFVAEDYHQDFYKNNPVRYKTYRFASGRDQFLESVWGDAKEAKNQKTNIKTTAQATQDIKSQEEGWENFVKPNDFILRQTLSTLSYAVTQESETERAFTEGNFHDLKEDGIYVDIVSGEPLYSSTDKFDSGTGWPSFSRAINDKFITYHEDNRFFMKRTELRSRYADSHLGHIFYDNPQSDTGARHCINGAALRFVPIDQMDSLGYGEYLYLFDN